MEWEGRWREWEEESEWELVLVWKMKKDSFCFLLNKIKIEKQTNKKQMTSVNINSIIKKLQQRNSPDILLSEFYQTQKLIL